MGDFSVACATTSKTLSMIPFIDSLVGYHVYKMRSCFGSKKQNLIFILGWGQRPSTRRARQIASVKNVDFWAIEDGFLRSFNTGKHSPPLSVVLDELGIYYDCSQPSFLEKLLTSNDDFLADQKSVFVQAHSILLAHGLSKYNHAPDFHMDILSSPVNTLKSVLIVDQTVGDMSVQLGGATGHTFTKMLAAAKAENPQAIIYVKTHPEVLSGQKSGFLTDVKPDEQIAVLREEVNPMSLLACMDKVYVVTSTMGFEALLAGKPVVCFGVPWYAGWGVTDDRCKDSPAWERRTRKRSVDELFSAAYISYTRYLDPVTHKRGNIMDVIHWLVRQKSMATQMHGAGRTGRVLGVGFRHWKAANLKPMLGLHTNLVGFVSGLRNLREQRLKPGDTVLCWGGKPLAGLVEYVSSCWARLLHVEDGFVRSVGLGSDLIRPYSLVLDERGIYFDATRPSDLEHMLSSRKLTPEDLKRSQQVRAFIVDHGITKYNLEPRQKVNWLSDGRLVVLVPGQVEDDASIKLGCTTVRTNLGLLQAVRAGRPDAFIVYKPHPDVLSGNRKGRLALQTARLYADHIEAGVSVVSCIESCHEVHTMTSLTGFDALLRGKTVVTYGQPFYAGWGLTEDRAENATAFERRKCRLTIDELVASTLLHYPIYWDWDLKGYTTCEAVLHRIVEQRAKLETNGGLHKLQVGYAKRQLRKLRIIFVSLFF